MRKLLAAMLVGVAVAAGAATGWTPESSYINAAAPPVRAAAAQSPAVDPDRMAVSLSAEEAAAVGNRPLKTLLKIDGRMRHGDFKWNEQGVGPGRVWVRVDLKHQIVSVFRNGHEIGTAVILYGAQSHGTPLGTFPIRARIKDHHSSIYDAPMPYTLRLTSDGVAIHGSDVRWGAATHGCIGVPIEFAKRLFGAVKVGVPVVIVDA